MKKLLAILSVFVIGASMTACSDKAEKSSSGLSVGNSSEDGNESKITSENNANDSSAGSSESSSSESESKTPAASTTDFQELIKVIKGTDEWAIIAEAPDDDLTADYFGLDFKNPNYKEKSINYSPISAVCAEIILIKTDKPEDVVKDMVARKDRLVNVNSYYPSVVEIAKNSVYGSIDGVLDGDSLVYFIAGTNAANGETNLKNHFNSAN